MEEREYVVYAIVTVAGAWTIVKATSEVEALKKANEVYEGWSLGQGEVVDWVPVQAELNE